MKDPEEINQIILSNLQYGFIIVQNKKIIYINDKTTDITGYSSEELLQKEVNHIIKHYSVFNSSDLSNLQNQIKNVDFGKKTKFIQQITNKEGQLCWLWVSIKKVLLYEEPAFFISFADITELKETENILKQKIKVIETKYQVISELVVNFEYAYQVRENNQLESLWVEGSFEQLTEYTQSELKQKGGWEALIHPHDISTAFQQLNQLLAGKSATVEYRILTKNGQIRWMRDYAYPVYEKNNNGVDKIIGAVQDITILKTLEQEAIKVKKMESLSVFAGGIAHDFNNLLSKILTGINIMQFELMDNDNVAPILEDIEKAVHLAHNLTQELKTIARGEKLKKSVINISDKIKEITQLTVNRTNVGVKYQLADNLAKVEVDENQICQVIQNLMINAIHANQNSKIILVKAFGTTLNQENQYHLLPGQYLQVSIIDEGEGIKEENKHRVFDPYYTTKKEGSGLGLAICYSVIHEHNGYIGYNSLYKGTEFFFLLPTVK
ncbi:MAG: PAS domain-containing protein [Spirochaetes bacterium]|nr:PAS domain-containing protein [Spirochaetota bacterium]